MGGADRRRAAAMVAVSTLLAACAGARYEPCPLQLGTPLPDDAFVRCRDELARRYGGLAIADRAAFLLQTDWVPVADPIGERRASVFRSDVVQDLAVVVEFRSLSTPWFGVPQWTEPRGDAPAERDLAAALRAALTAAH